MTKKCYDDWDFSIDDFSASLVCLSCKKEFQCEHALLHHCKAKKHRCRTSSWEERDTGHLGRQSAEEILSPEQILLIAPADTPLLHLPPSALDRHCPSVGTTSGLEEKNPSRAAVQEIFVDFPAPVWVLVLSFLSSDSRGGLGSGNSSAPAVLAFISASILRNGVLSEASFWDAFTAEICGFHQSGTHAHISHRLAHFMQLSSSTEEAHDIWSIVNGSAPVVETGFAAKSCRIMRQKTPNYPVLAVTVGDNFIACASRGSTDIRLYNHYLRKLPSIRVRGKSVETLAIAQGDGHLAVGASDSQVSLQSITDPEEAPVPLYRNTPPTSVAMEGEIFAGLHFVDSSWLVAAMRDSNTVVLLDVERRGPPISKISSEINAGLLCAIPLSGNDKTVSLLVDTTGGAYIWDVRTSSPVPMLGFSMPHATPQHFTAATAEAYHWTVAAASNQSVYWGDLRTSRAVELPVAPPPVAARPILAFGPRRSLVACWEFGNSSVASVYARGSMHIPAHVGTTQLMPIAACPACNQRPLVLSLVNRAEDWNFELCSLSMHTATALPIANITIVRKPTRLSKAVFPTPTNRSRHSGSLHSRHKKQR